MEYTVDLVSEPSVKDDHIEHGGAHVYVAPEAALYLLGTEMVFEAKIYTQDRFCLPQPKRELGLRLRRIGRAEARRPQGIGRRTRRRGVGDPPFLPP